MKKIAFVGQDMFAQGAQHVMARLTRGLIARGYDVDILMSKVHTDYVAEGRAGAFPVPPQTRWIFMKDRRARHNVGQLRQYLKTTDASVVVAQDLNYCRALRLASIGLRKRPMLLYVEHGLASCNDRGEFLPPQSKWSLRSLFLRWFWSKYDRIFVVSRSAVNDFLKVNPWYDVRRMHVVYNPVVDDELFMQAQRPPRHPWLRQKTVKTFVSAGAFVKNKGHMTILRAMKEVKARGYGVRVVIFGQGPLETEYRRFIAQNGLEDSVSIAKFTDNFPGEVNASDGYLLSSETESFGLTLVESLACGCPIVATDAPYGPREILKDGKYGTLVPVGDVMAYCQAIIKLANSPRISPPKESWTDYTIDVTVIRYLKGLDLMA